MNSHCMHNPHRWRAGAIVFAAALAFGTPVHGAPAPDARATALIAELGLKASPVAARDLPGWKAPKRIVVTRVDAKRMAQLQAVAPGVELVSIGEDGALPAQVAGAEAVIGRCDPEILEGAKAVHWLQVTWAGVEECVQTPGLAKRGIVLTNMQRMMGPPIAEHAIALTMALARNLPQYARYQHAGEWKRGEGDRARMHEIGGRTMLVVGLGGIGTEIARRAHALGMRVIATRNSSREGPAFVAKVGLPEELLALAAEADVVVNATPLTRETTGIFNQAFFDAMKPGGYFVNIARGGSVVTDALVAALRSGRLAGAGLDVTDPEPLPAKHALWSMPNVLITPHVSSSSEAQSERNWLLVTENVRRYVAGEPLLNVVDIERGY